MAEELDERWDVFTMTHDEDMFDEDGDPVDSPDFREWMVGVVTRPGHDDWFAASARVVAQDMTFGAAQRIAAEHNAALESELPPHPYGGG